MHSKIIILSGLMLVQMKFGYSSGLLLSWKFIGYPQIKDYWSMDSLLGVTAVQQSMSLRRLWQLWSNLHLVDNETAPATGGPARIRYPN